MFNSYCALLKELGKQLDFGDIIPSEDGKVTLDFGGLFLDMAFNADTGMIAMYAPVYELPEDCPKEVYKRLLEAQCFFKDTNGVTFSYDITNSFVLAHLNVYVQMLNADNFMIAVQNILHVSERFYKEIEEMLANAKSEENTASIDINESAYMIRI